MEVSGLAASIFSRAGWADLRSRMRRFGMRRRRSVMAAHAAELVRRLGLTAVGERDAVGRAEAEDCLELASRSRWSRQVPQASRSEAYCGRTAATEQGGSAHPDPFVRPTPAEAPKS
jgi:hypothetical protein